MSGASAGGSPTPPAGGTRRDAATDDREQAAHIAQLYCDVLRAKDRVVRTARRWRRALCEHRVAAATSAQLALREAVVDYETAHQSLNAAIRCSLAHAEATTLLNGSSPVRCDVRGCVAVATSKLATDNAWLTMCDDHREHVTHCVWSQLPPR